MQAITTIATVTRGGISWFAALAAAVLAIASLSACGDSESDSKSTSASTQSDGPDTGGGAQQTQKNGQGDNKQGSDNSSQKTADASPAKVATPLHVSGGGSEQFRSKGGDNSIQEYGEESDESELQEVAEAVHGFYVARAEEDWGRACTYLAKSMVSQLEAIAAQSPELRDKGCAVVLKAFTRPLPAVVRRETTVVDAGSFRHDDERGFLIYYDSEDKPFAIPLEDEDGEWKLTLLSATPLG